jgi:hypothetical protein
MSQRYSKGDVRMIAELVNLAGYEAGAEGEVVKRIDFIAPGDGRLRVQIVWGAGPTSYFIGARDAAKALESVKYAMHSVSASRGEIG